MLIDKIDVHPKDKVEKAKIVAAKQKRDKKFKDYLYSLKFFDLREKIQSIEMDLRLERNGRDVGFSREELLEIITPFYDERDRNFYRSWGRKRRLSDR